MVHMDGTHGRLARRRLSLAEFDYVVQTRPGASNHAAYTMLRILTRAEDDGAITDAVLCLALPNSSAACQRQPQAKGGLLSLLTLLELLECQADDGRRKEARATMDGNDKSWFREDANRIMVRTAPWDGTEQVYVPTHMRYGVLMLGHYPPPARNAEASRMYTSMRRWFYWESMVVHDYTVVASCMQCARYRVGKRRKTKYLKTFPPTELLTNVCLDLLFSLPQPAAENEYLFFIVDCFSKMMRAITLSWIDTETIAAAFSDYWVTACGPPATVISETGPQFRSTLFQGSATPRDLPPVLHDVLPADEPPSGAVQPDHRGATADVNRRSLRTMR